MKIYKQDGSYSESQETLAKTETSDFVVETVFSVVEYGGQVNGHPHIFKTSVHGGRLDGEEYFYCTRAAAMSGHDAVVFLIDRMRDTP